MVLIQVKNIYKKMRGDLMITKESLAVDIGSSYTKVLVGDNQKIRFCGLIRTPEKSLIDDNIINVDAVKNAIQGFLHENSAKPEEISFAIHGHDIVIRHIEIPLMDEKEIKKSVDWEITQFLPENGTNYYIDYEVLNRVNTKEKKACSVLIVAAPKGKINKYAELASSLGLKLKTIDIAANCVSRVFRQITKDNTAGESTGIIDLGHSSSNIIILDNGKLFMEREVTFGIRKLIAEVSRKLGEDEQSTYSYLFQKFNFGYIDNENEIEKNIQNLFENALSTFDKVIQFYTSGKSEKKLDRIYLIGGGCQIPGIGNYIKNYFGSPVYIVNSPSKISLKIKVPVGFDFRVYVNTLGLLLRKE